MKTLTCIISFIMTTLCLHSQKTFKLDNWIIPEGVKVEHTTFKGKDAIHVDNSKKEKGGIIYLKGVNLMSGEIECDIASDIFTGIAFRVQNDSLTECVYFRPFNSGTKKHKNTVQYVTKGTKYKWNYLRENFPEEYESGADIENNEWFHVRLVFKDKSVKVFVNDADNPVIVVNDLKLDKEKGSVGIWTWKGYYANFKINP